MIIINEIDDSVFELNGIKYLKNYLSRPYGDKLEIYNCYERADVLAEQAHYSTFLVNGLSYPDAPALQAVLLTVLYNRNSLSDSIFPDATATAKGKIKLAGDFDPAGTADAPRIKAATATTAGKSKLYTGTGSNEDGGMTQKAVTEVVSSFARNIPHILVCDVNDSVEYTGNTMETIIKSYNIAAQDLNLGKLSISSKYLKTGSGTVSIKVYLNDVNQIHPSALVAHFTMASTTIYQPFQKDLIIKTGKIFGYNASVSSASIEHTSPYSPLEANFTLGINHFVIFTVHLSNSLDSIIQKECEIIFKKVL